MFSKSQHGIPTDIRDWLSTIAASAAGRPGAAADVRLLSVIEREEARLFFCEVPWPDSPRAVCVKQFSAESPQFVEKVFARTVAIRPLLTDLGIDVPEYFACNGDARLIAMSVETGTTIEDLIVRSFRAGRGAEQRCLEAARELGGVLARFHSVEVPADIPMAMPCSNREYVTRIRKYLREPWVLSCLTNGDDSPGRLLERLPQDFWERHESRVLHGDFQAKNAMIDAAGRLKLIDFEFGHGHPLFDVAQFLVQLVRLERRWNLRRATRKLELYGNAFLDAYFAAGLEYLKGDLPFFMLWCTTFSLQADTGHPLLARLYIRRHLRRSRLAAAWGLFGDRS